MQSVPASSGKLGLVPLGKVVGVSQVQLRDLGERQGSLRARTRVETDVVKECVFLFSDCVWGVLVCVRA